MTARSRLVRRLQRHGRIGTLVGPSPAPVDSPSVVPRLQPLVSPPPAKDFPPGPGPIPQPEVLEPQQSEPPDAKATDDPNWSKLKAIYRSHKEKESLGGDGDDAVGEKPTLNVVPKQPAPKVQRNIGSGTQIQLETEEELPLVEKPEAAAQPVEPAATPGGSPDAGTALEPQDQSRQVSGIRSEMQEEIERPKPDHPEEEVVQRLFPPLGPVDPFAPPIPGPVPIPFPGIPGFPGFPGGSSGGGGSPTVPSGTGDTEIGGDATVGGNMESGGGIEAGGNIMPGGSLTAGGNVSGNDISAGGGISAGANVEAGGNVNAGTSVDAGGEVSAGGNINPGGSVTSGADTGAGADMTVEGGVTAGANVTTGGSLSGAGAVDAGAGISTGESLRSENVTAGSNLISIGGIEVGGNAQVGGVLMGLGSVDVGGTTHVGGAIVSTGATRIEGSASVGSLVMSTGTLSFGSAAVVGGAVIAKGATDVQGVLTTPYFKGEDVTIGGSLGTATIKAGTLSAGGSVTIGGRANVGTINASSVTIHGSAKISSGGGSVATKPADGAPEPGVPLNEAWPVQRRAEAVLPLFPTAVKSASGVEFIPPRGPRPVPASRPQTEPSPLPGAAPASEEPVRTEIGDLPADLWQLLGRQSPESENAQGKRGQASRSTRPQIPDLQLRAPEPAPVQLAAAAEPDSEGTDERTGGPDVEALARKVYSQLRKRLYVEAERSSLGHGKS